MNTRSSAIGRFGPVVALLFLSGFSGCERSSNVVATRHSDSTLGTDQTTTIVVPVSPIDVVKMFPNLEMDITVDTTQRLCVRTWFNAAQKNQSPDFSLGWRTGNGSTACIRGSDALKSHGLEVDLSVPDEGLGNFDHFFAFARTADPDIPVVAKWANGDSAKFQEVAGFSVLAWTGPIPTFIVAGSHSCRVVGGTCL